jgi:molybdopterin-guanine dinucleotide biosynthesis protein A
MLACLDSVTAVAGSEGAYDDLRIRTIADLSPGNGPMAALQAALHDRGHGWIFLVSCDMLSLRWHWIRELAQQRTGQSLAVAFRHSHWEPMCALYHTDLRELVDRRVSAGRLSMQELLQEIPVGALPMPGNWPRIAQANTRQDLHTMIADLFLPGFDLFKAHP